MIGKQLEKLRLDRHLSKSSMAKLLEIPYSTYHFYETNKTNPTLETLLYLADYFHVSTDYLLGISIITSYNNLELSQEQLQLLLTYETLSVDIQRDFMKYADFCLLQEADQRSRSCNTSLNAAMQAYTLATEPERQSSIQNFSALAIYSELKGKIYKEIHNTRNEK